MNGKWIATNKPLECGVYNCVTHCVYISSLNIFVYAMINTTTNYENECLKLKRWCFFGRLKNVSTPFRQLRLLLLMTERKNYSMHNWVRNVRPSHRWMVWRWKHATNCTKWPQRSYRISWFDKHLKIYRNCVWRTNVFIRNYRLAHFLSAHAGISVLRQYTMHQFKNELFRKWNLPIIIFSTSIIAIHIKVVSNCIFLNKASV